MLYKEDETMARLGKVSQELNIGMDKIVEFLQSKGVQIENNPSAKITDKHYKLLLDEFGEDAEIKKSAESVDIREVRQNMETVSLPDPEPVIEYKEPRKISEIENSKKITDNLKVTEIGENAFRGCWKLTKIKISNSVSEIGGHAFHGCRNLTEIKIPISVRRIGDFAFYCCSGLKKVTISNSVEEIGDYAFQDCSNLTNINIPDSITKIGKCAFHGCRNLTEINIPSSVKKIGYCAFYRCSGLKKVTISNSVEEIGLDVFYDCSSLESVTIPDSVTKVGESAFHGCSSLKSITIPNSVSEIGRGAFSGCTELREIVVEKGNEHFRLIDGVLYDDLVSILIRCPIEKDSIVIPDTVKKIDNGAFEGCDNLTNITMPMLQNMKSIINSLTNINVKIIGEITEIADYAFSGCCSLKSVTIPNSVTKIGESAFVNCKSLSTISIPISVREIGQCAFKNCTCLEGVKIPNSVKKIGKLAFENCAGLTSLSIPNSIKVFEDGIFNNCEGLKKVNIRFSEEINVENINLTFVKEGIRYKVINGKTVLFVKVEDKKDDYSKIPSQIEIGNKFNVINEHCVCNENKVPKKSRIDEIVRNAAKGELRYGAIGSFGVRGSFYTIVNYGGLSLEDTREHIISKHAPFAYNLIYRSLPFESEVLFPRKSYEIKDVGSGFYQTLDDIGRNCRKNTISKYIRKQGEKSSSPILNKEQNEVKRCHFFDGIPIGIDGGPGVGKTSTMIQRLMYLIEDTAITEEEMSEINKNKLKEFKKKKQHWIFFSHTSELKDYLERDMESEGLSESSTHTKVWPIYRDWTLNHLGLYSILVKSDCELNPLLEGIGIYKDFSIYFKIWLSKKTKNYLSQKLGKFEKVYTDVNSLNLSITKMIESLKKRYKELDFNYSLYDGKIIEKIKNILKGKNELSVFSDLEKKIRDLQEWNYFLSIWKKEIIDIRDVQSIIEKTPKDIVSEIANAYLSFRTPKEHRAYYDIKVLESLKQKEITSQEQSFLLGFVLNFFQENKNEFKNFWEGNLEQYYYPVVAADEIFDYNVFDLYAIAAHALSDFNSIILAGDAMQRIDEYGVKDWNECKKIFPKLEVRQLSISHRQTQKLLDIAKTCIANAREFVSAVDVEIAPEPLKYVSEDPNKKIKWIQDRIVEIYNIYGKILPAIAIFAKDEKGKKFIEQKLSCPEEIRRRDQWCQLKVYTIV